jgi:hypothetical protein
MGPEHKWIPAFFFHKDRRKYNCASNNTYYNVYACKCMKPFLVTNYFCRLSEAWLYTKFILFINYALKKLSVQVDTVDQKVCPSELFRVLPF